MASADVSVIIQSRDQGQHLEECLESIACQTYRHWEVIAVDAGSTDNSLEILDSYAARYPGRFIVLERDQEPSGGTAALNTGMRAIRGNYFTWLSAGDRCLPTKFEELVQMLEASPDAGMAHSAYRIIDGAGEFQSTHAPDNLPGTMSFFRLLETNIVGSGTTLVRRDVLNEIGLLLESDEYTPDPWRIAEYVWWLELALRYEVVCTEKPLHEIRMTCGAAYPGSAFADALARIAKRVFLRKYGLKRVAATLSMRSGTPRSEVYRYIASTLGLDILPEDVVLIGDAIREESEREAAAIRSALLEVQKSWIASTAMDYYVSAGSRAF